MPLQSTQSLTLPVAIVIAGAMIAGSIIWSMHEASTAAREADPPRQQQAKSAAPVSPPVNVADVSTKGNPFIGAATAPAVMALWTDYQCPYCRQLELTVLPKLITDYVKTGKLRIVFKDFQFLGPDSQAAGLAARAVWKVAPDKFYEWHKAMFERQDAENAGWGSKADILALTRSIPGIDAVKVEKLMIADAPAYREAMKADLTEGISFGINGTPGAIVGKQLLVGAQSYSVFKAAVDVAEQTAK